MAGWALIRSVKCASARRRRVDRAQHGEGELMEPETIEKQTNCCSMMKKTTSTAMICRVYMKHHINKHTVNRKVNYHRPLIYDVEHA